MTAGVTLYHNPKCSTSRTALALLRDRGIEPRIVEYLETPLDRAALGTLLGQLGIPARQLLRRKEPAYRELGLDDPALDEARLIDAMASHPILMERPVVANGTRAKLGRPPEKVLEILD